MYNQIRVEYIDHMGSDMDIVDAARVSFSREMDPDRPLEITKQDERLIQFLARGMTQKDYDRLIDQIWMADNRHEVEYLINEYRRTPTHLSPFNHVFMKFRVTAPIMVARQLVKHEYLPWNERSGRYVKDDLEVFHPQIWRQQADNVKQGSSDQPVQHSGRVHWSYQDTYRHATATYRNMIEEDGVCTEQARGVLPQNQMTRWIWSGSLGAFAKMCVLRLDSHAQYESRLVAQEIDILAREIFPVSWKALMKYGT